MDTMRNEGGPVPVEAQAYESIYSPTAHPPSAPTPARDRLQHPLPGSYLAPLNNSTDFEDKNPLGTRGGEGGSRNVGAVEHSVS